MKPSIIVLTSNVYKRKFWYICELLIFLCYYSYTITIIYSKDFIKLSGLIGWE